MYPPPLPSLLAQASVTSSALDSALEDFATFQSHVGSTWMLWLAFSQLLLILGFWISSVVLGKSAGALGSAIKLWLLYLLGFALVGTLIWFTAMQGGILALAGGVLGALVLIPLVFSLPMGIYKLPAPNAVAFVLVSIVLNSAGQIAANNLIGWTHFPSLASFAGRAALLPAPEKKELLRLLRGEPTATQVASAEDQATVEDRAKPIPVRHAAIKRLYVGLKARHAQLTPEAADAIAEYRKEDARYRQLLADLQADAAAARTPANPAVEN